MARLTCNISARGRWVRMLCGAVLVGGGGVLAWSGGRAALICGGVAMIVGLFQMVEGVFGWCVVRALGFRTPI
ncbi:MAG: hypothetical protein U1A27_04765 [Phycisphaerae bacterium]